MLEVKAVSRIPMPGQVAGISCGIYQGTAVLDLDYDEDANAQADANFVLTESGGVVEIQATAEDNPFSRGQFDALLALAEAGVRDLTAIQRQVLGL
jgi:ribonuclease PH